MYMAYIDNSETTRELDEAIRGNANTNQIPTNIAGQVVPVINVNPKDYRRANIVGVGTGTLYTIPANKRFFLTNISLAVSSTTPGTNVGAISITPKGQLAQAGIYAIAEVPAAGGTASQVATINLSFPIELEPGSAIATSATAGTTSRRGTIYGFTTEV